MKKMWVIVMAGLMLAGAAWASEKGSAKEAKAMVGKAVAYLNANGQAKAFAEFDNSRGKFVDRDLYIWVSDLKGKVVSHGVNAKLIGKELYGLRDTDGKQFIKEIIDVAKAKGSGWVDYKYTNPVSKKVEQKSVYFEKVKDLIIVCGFYK